METDWRTRFINLAGLMIPLILGVLVYITSGHRTYLSEFIHNSGLIFRTIDYPDFFRNYACDFLWGYALFSGLYLINGGYKDAGRIVITSIIVIIVLEGIQVFPGIPGVFDPSDILIETSAVLTAMFITSITGRLSSK